MKVTVRLAASLALSLSATGCASSGVGLPGSGPTTGAVERRAAESADIQIVDLDAATARQAAAAVQHGSLAGLPDGGFLKDRIGRGEQLEITLWEAAPAVLFAGLSDLSGAASGRSLALPPQVVDLDGMVTVPFVGRISVADRSAAEVEATILKALKGKAHQPQALVRVTSNQTQDVTIVGEVVQSTRMPLSPKGERLLDAIAAASGTKAPIEKVMVQVTRRGESVSVPLERVVREPQQNVRLAAGDIVSVYHQTKSFIAMGAVGKAGETPFEATGLTLAQALGRVGGPADNRADPGGVFIFRLVDGKPTVYRIDLSDPTSLFAIRDFPIEDRDVLYVANAPTAELQKFLSLVSSAIYPLDAARNLWGN